MERAYTLAEIDRMRAAVRYIQSSGGGRVVLWSSDPREQEVSEVRRAAREHHEVARVEQELRTYLLAGVEPAALEQKAATISVARAIYMSMLPLPSNPARLEFYGG